MKNLRMLLIECSPRQAKATSSALGRRLVHAITQRSGREVELIERNIGAHPLPPLSADYAESLLSSPQLAHGSPDAAIQASDQLIAELQAADVVVIAAPVHNFGIPASLKLWVDLVVRNNVTFKNTAEGKKGLLADRPTLVAVASGGAMFREPPRQPDFFRPYLNAAFGVIGIQDISYVPSTGLAFCEQPLAEVESSADAWIEGGLADFLARFDKEAA